MTNKEMIRDLVAAAKELIAESVLFTKDDIQDAIKELTNGLKTPYVNVTKASLGHGTIMITISMQEKKDWKNGILENSDYARIQLDSNGSIEHFSGYGMKKLRKGKVKSIQEAIKKINDFATKAKQE